MTEISKIQFTPADANKRLPLVSRIVSDILIKKQRLKEISNQSPAATESSPEVLDIQDKMKALTQELEDLGCYFNNKHADYGHVHFPSVIDGETVFLCWRSDEMDVRYFHYQYEGYENRKAIPPHYLN